ncbi:MAG: Bcr/CflA family efflux MFS transporter [Porticoccaceae bacterium]|jgi:DHA1 family bicyclomycin/chloramphenicol resistance-like MFS transporter
MPNHSTTAVSLPFSLIIALALTMMLGPFSLDTYLPAFPMMANALNVDQQAVSLSVSVYIFALAFGQLIGGALSDRFGRQLIVYTGLSLFAVTSLLLSLAESLTPLLIGRVFQAFGAGWVLVSVPALVRDRIAGQQAAKMFSLMGLIMIIAPGIAPSIGSLFLALGSWRMIFVFLAVYALALIPLLAFAVFGSAASPRPGSRNFDQTITPGLLARYKAVLSTASALPFIAWQAASFSVMMLFITHASFIYQQHFQQSAESFSLLFAANIVAMMIFNLGNRALLSRFKSLRILQLATLCQGGGILLLVIAAVFGWPLYGFVLAMMVSIGSLGAITPNIQACFLDYFAVNSGTAAALMGAAQFGIAGILSALSAFLPHTLTAVALAMAACALVSFSFMLMSLATKR